MIFQQSFEKFNIFDLFIRSQDKHIVKVFAKTIFLSNLL